MTDDVDDADGLAWLGADGRAADELATIWATVDTERALRDLGFGPDLAAAAVDDPLLGARVVVVAEAPGGTRIALAEPSTEGRLAAFLARNDEGPAGRYVGLTLGIDAVLARAAAAAILVSRPAVGPFGREVLILDGRRGASHVLLVEVAAVPSRP